METYRLDYVSPIGILEIVGTEMAIRSILFVERTDVCFEADETTPDVLNTCYREIEEYFNGRRQSFTFPYEVMGTVFQQDVWQALVMIPYGETTSYRELAMTLGRDRAVRAVGSANGRNRLSIVLPCHRVIGSNGTLTGYAGGLWRKEWLLRHEQTNTYSNLSKKHLPLHI
ncbi:MAG: methylated-DNA--[protein]-cysteine S-methyltransferase [Exiguobacterium chiriqhucha]|uniref:methylated-DNA--[protein]-cysteine S-methyltransferase n=1 Tax=Exiguobacterium chiriqhucha TaxID=1385984 RepID=UPI00144B468D|nr:methylated-DNA--[protein]-cysteine S-methyltransferase [Exiguobacterium chiriqhucha]KAB2860920.1 MAG: methylated-DNA--[protein]-cysteine S-methyltransferase [Exiguobacterium chiriqhucha]